MESETEVIYQSILFIGTFGMLLLTSAIIFFIYIYQRKLIKRKLAFQEIESLLKEQELKSTYALLEGQDIERKRIASELHDNLGSILVTLNMYADTAMSSQDINKKNELLAKVKEIGLQASDHTRDLSHRLDSAALQHFGLKTAIHDLLEAIQDNRSIRCMLNIDLDTDLNKDLALNLYRIVQELVNNTLKHAHASAINLELSIIKNDYVSLIYADNGIGFDHHKETTGVGLINITSRVNKFDGSIKFDSGIEGVSVLIEIPL